MPAPRNQRSTGQATTRAERTTARRGKRWQRWQRQRQDRPLMGWEDNIDLGEEIIPIQILNLVCAVHLRQEHGFKRWQIGKFKETYPWLIREDGIFAFAALHYLVHVLVHVEEAAVPLDESGTVAVVRLIKPPGVTDHLDA